MASLFYESYYTQNLSAVSVTSTTFSDILSRTFSPVQQQDFVFFAGGYNQTRASDAANSAGWRMILNSTVTVAHERTTVQNDIPQPGGMGFFMKDDLPFGTYLLKTQQNSNSGSVQTRSNVALAIGGLNIVAAASYLSGVSMATTEVNALSLTFTPEEPGTDHLILASAIVGAGSSGDTTCTVKVDGNEKMITRAYRGALGANTRSMFMVKKENLAAGSHTVVITGQATGGASTGSVSQLFIAVIQLT